MKILAIINIDNEFKILTNEQEIKTYYLNRFYPNVKFVVFCKEKEQYAIFLTQIDSEKDIIEKMRKNKFDLVGRGFYYFSFNLSKLTIDFDSENCQKIFGNNKSCDKTERDFIIKNIKKLIKKYF